MLDIGTTELLVVIVMALLILGPERLPEALRTLGLWLGRLRRSFTSVKAEIEKEIGMDEVKRQLHNEAVMAEMKRIEQEVQSSVDEAKIDPGLGATQAAKENPASELQDAPSPDAADTAQSEDTQPEPGATDLPEPAQARPRTEAEVEAAYERKMRAQQASKDAH